MGGLHQPMPNPNSTTRVSFHLDEIDGEEIFSCDLENVPRYEVGQAIHLEYETIPPQKGKKNKVSGLSFYTITSLEHGVKLVHWTGTLDSKIESQVTLEVHVKKS